MKKLLLIMVLIAIVGCGKRPTPEPLALARMSDVEAARTVLDAASRRFMDVAIDPDIPAVLVIFEMIGSNERVAWSSMQAMLCGLRESGRFKEHMHQFTGMIDAADALGNHMMENGITARVQPDIIEQVNCGSDGGRVNFEMVAERYWVRPGLPKVE